MRRAAVDIGTVTTRLLIADVEDGRLREVVRRTVVTHLGEGLHDTGRLSAEGIERVSSACAGFAADISQNRVTDVRAVATSASRDASNVGELLGRLESIGLRPKVISGETEARLSFRGATHGLDEDDVLVADLGGGSTELVFGCAADTDEAASADIDAARSVDVGSRRVLDMFLHSDPPTIEELDVAEAWIAEELRPFFDALRSRPRMLITLAGTGTTLSAVHQSLVTYDPAKVHGSLLTGAEIAGIKDELASMPLSERRRVKGMDPQRADVIVAGALILLTILGLAGLDSTVVSEHDILYGLVLEGA